MSKVSLITQSLLGSYRKKCLMLEKSTCRSETVYWWKLVVEAAYWFPFFSPIRIKFIINLCFLTKNLELAENVVLLEVLYRQLWSTMLCVCATKIFLRARGVPFKLKEIYFGANPRGAKVQIWIFKSCDIFKILVTGGLLNVDMYVSGVLHYNLIMEFMFTGHR